MEVLLVITSRFLPSVVDFYNGRRFGGDLLSAWYVRLPSFQIGKFKIKGLVTRLQAVEDSLNNKLAGNIGQDILQRFTVTVDCRRAVMYLEKHRSGTSLQPLTEPVCLLTTAVVRTKSKLFSPAVPPRSRASSREIAYLQSTARSHRTIRTNHFSSSLLVRCFILKCTAARILGLITSPCVTCCRAC